MASSRSRSNRRIRIESTDSNKDSENIGKSSGEVRLCSASSKFSEGVSNPSFEVETPFLTSATTTTKTNQYEAENPSTSSSDKPNLTFKTHKGSSIIFKKSRTPAAPPHTGPELGDEITLQKTIRDNIRNIGLTTPSQSQAERPYEEYSSSSSSYDWQEPSSSYVVGNGSSETLETSKLLRRVQRDTAVPITSSESHESLIGVWTKPDSQFDVDELRSQQDTEDGYQFGAQRRATFNVSSSNIISLSKTTESQGLVSSFTPTLGKAVGGFNIHSVNEEDNLPEILPVSSESSSSTKPSSLSESSVDKSGLFQSSIFTDDMVSHSLNDDEGLKNDLTEEIPKTRLKRLTPAHSFPVSLKKLTSVGGTSSFTSWTTTEEQPDSTTDPSSEYQEEMKSSVVESKGKPELEVSKRKKEKRSQKLKARKSQLKEVEMVSQDSSLGIEERGKVVDGSEVAESPGEMERRKTVAKKKKKKKDKDEMLKEVLPMAKSEGEVVVDAKKETKKKKHTAKHDEIESTEVVEPCTSTSDSESQPESPPGEILGIVIHQMDGLKMHFFISHPVVQVHLYDLTTGTYIEKKDKRKRVTSFYENESAPVKHIMPMMTQPYEMKGKQNLTPEWQEMLVFNEKFCYFLQNTPRVLIFFEILDFVSMNQASKQYQKLGKDGGWYRIAWAFLKLVGANNVQNVNKKVQLQLFYPLEKRWRSPCNPASNEVFGWWENKSKRKYPYTLYVTVKGVTIPEVQPGLRSMIPTQEERGHMTLEDLKRKLEGKSSVVIESGAAGIQIDGYHPHWSRIPGQLCKIPKERIRTISVGNKGCFVARFSNNGRYLACDSADEEIHSILIFEIPSGELKGKLSSHFGMIYELSWSPNDMILLSSSADCTARLWVMDKVQYKSSRILPHPSYVYSSKFHPRVYNIVVTTCYDNVVRVWDSSKQECELIQELTQHSSLVNTACFDEQGDVLYTGDGAGVICIWNVYVTSKPNKSALVRDWTLNREVKCKELLGKVISDIIFHPGGRRVFVSSRDGCIRLIDVREFTLIQLYQGHQNVRQLIHFSVTPCGSFVLSGSEDGCLYVWNTSTGAKVHTYSDLPFKKTITTIDYHPHEHMLVCCAFEECFPVLIYKFGTLDATPFVGGVTADLPPLDTKTSLPPRSRRRRPSTGILKPIPPQQLMSESLSGNAIYDHNTPIATQDLKPKARPRLSKELLSKEMSMTSSSSLTPSKSTVLSEHPSTSTLDYERSRTVTFEDEVVSTSDKWKTVFDKLDVIIGSSSSTTSQLSTESGLQCDRTTITTSEQTVSSSEFKAISLYSFTASNKTELSLKPGDIVSVTSKATESWWSGLLSNGQNGLFPSSCVTPCSEIDSSQSSSKTPSKPPRRKQIKKSHMNIRFSSDDSKLSSTVTSES